MFSLPMLFLKLFLFELSGLAHSGAFFTKANDFTMGKGYFPQLCHLTKRLDLVFTLQVTFTRIPAHRGVIFLIGN